MDYPFIGAFRARCEKVVDGDTVDLYVDLGFHSFRRERFRIIGINAPELRGEERPAGLASKAALESILNVSGQWPLMITTKKDPDFYGRWLAEIFLQPDDPTKPQVSVGQLMIELGHAVPYMP